jgi:radical SAM protein with 4Fe4S-binding SPASM domain
VTPSKLIQSLQSSDIKPPRILTLAITGACNLSCHHCWVNAGGSSPAADVPLATLHQIVSECAALGAEGIRITGGEPLCHPHWLDILQQCRTLKFKTLALQTNGMLLHDEHCAALRALDFPGLSIQISLGGASSANHDLVRGEGSFKAALQGIEKLVQHGLGQRVSIFFTEMRHNLGDIPELLDLADRIGIGAVTTGAMVRSGRAAATSLLAPPGIEQYQALLKRYEDDAHFRQLYAKHGTVAAIEWQSGDAVRAECCTFIENPYLTPLGRLYPCLLCHTDEFSVSDVFAKGLTTALYEGMPLWESLLRISRQRTDALSECQECSGKQRCGGGCMGRAQGSLGELLAVDDRCEVRRSIYHQL